MRYSWCIGVMLGWCVCVWGQTTTDQKVRDKRTHMIHLHHIGIGAETAMSENVRFSARAYYGIGSYRNLLNADIGVKYALSHPLLHIAEEKITAHYMAPFIAATVNYYRWANGGLYLGGECAYHLAVAANHHLPSATVVEHDNVAASHHCSLRAKAGSRWENWDICLHFEYDLAPALNQKYVFESTAYNYDLLRPSLFERWRIGITAAYLIPF